MTDKKDIRDRMERIYGDVPLVNIPWNLSDPPELLAKAIETGKIKPCRAVDLGCGAGNYSVWLAQNGFEVTGFDISEHAIKHAQDLAIKKGVSCQFIAANLLGDLKLYQENFDFAFDYSDGSMLP